MITVKDKETWNRILNKLNINDIFFSYEYFEIYKTNYNVDLEAVYWEDENVIIFFPHLVRNIKNIPLFKELKEDYYDLTTPYGYGGPVVKIKIDKENKIKESIRKFKLEYYKYALIRNYVCEFIRFHPILENHKYFCEIFNVEYINDIVYINLSQNLDEIWKSIKYGQRYNIRKTIKENCKIEVIDNPKEIYIDIFLYFYNNMLKRNKSSKKYYFSRKFIEDHFKNLNTVLFLAKINKNYIGAAIFLISKDTMYYHLSGNLKIKGIYSNDLIIWEAIKYAKSRNFKFLFLGGGRGNNDSLFKYKLSFSQNIKPFYVGKIIFNDKLYNNLTNLAKVSKEEKFFPAYRKNFDETIV